MLGRALRDVFEPVSLNFWRWFVALVVLLPFAVRAIAGKGEIVRRHAPMLALLALLSVPLFQTMVYQGLRTTTAINAVLLNSSAPVFMIACSWLVNREHATRRQIAGMLISLAGIVIIMTRGELARLAELQFHAGDAWILAAIPLWGLYSVLLKRRPPELGGVAFLFVITLLGVTMLAPFFMANALAAPPVIPSWEVGLAVLYVGLGETDEEIIAVMRDLRAHDVDMLTIGQYLQPSPHHLPVERYVEPAVFRLFEARAAELGFRHAAIGALVRSSYHADQQAHQAGVA